MTEAEREVLERDATDREEAAVELMLAPGWRRLEAELIRETDLHVRMAARPNMASTREECSAAQAIDRWSTPDTEFAAEYCCRNLWPTSIDAGRAGVVSSAAALGEEGTVRVWHCAVSSWCDQ